MTFYSVNDWPYIAIIDPRTGELLAQWQKMDALSFCDIITEFLSNHPPLQDGNCSTLAISSASPPSKKAVCIFLFYLLIFIRMANICI